MMPRLLKVSCCVLIMAAPALGAEAWPDAFRIQCGDTRHKVPYDPTDERGTLVPMFTGEAVRLTPGELSGYYAQGMGYRLTIMLKDQKLTGTPEPLAVKFLCQTRDPNDTQANNKMTCSSDLRQLPTVPGFNMITASLSVPGVVLRPGSAVLNTVTVRQQVREETPGTQIIRYYQNVREMLCEYSR